MLRLKSKYFLLILAGAAFAFALFMMVWGGRAKPTPRIPFPPPTPPFVSFVAGSGILEAASLNISIGAPYNEIITDIYVIAGDKVKQGDPLFTLDLRTLNAKLTESSAQRETSVGYYEKLLHEPRVETVPPKEATVSLAQSHFLDQKTQLDLYESVQDKQAISQNELNQRRYAVAMAKSELDYALAELALLKAGSWSEDLHIALCEIEKAEANIDVVKSEIEKSTIRAPIDGEILQVNIRIGEKAEQTYPDPHQNPLILMGDTSSLHIRVEIDQEDAWRVKKGAPGWAFVRGNSSLKTPLEFVRIEPYIIPKTAFTGDNVERVDTRVLQILYKVQDLSIPIFAGELMDVFLEAAPSNGESHDAEK
jgi:multidrug efflux pump subunit AcrA (membrane-fusion protein)